MLLLLPGLVTVTAFCPSIIRCDDGTRATGVLVRSAASDVVQANLYGELCGSVAGTREHSSLLSTAITLTTETNEPSPLCAWRHPYTRQTNTMHKPTLVFDFAQQLAQRTAAALRMVNADPSICNGIDHAKYDSLLAILYRSAGTLPPHVDRDLHGFGLALSLGASAMFDLGGTELLLESGDAVFADFGRIKHSVLETLPVESSAPAWWRALPTTSPRDGDGPCTFGRVRCSLQLRDRAWAIRPHPSDPHRFVRRTVRLRRGTR